MASGVLGADFSGAAAAGRAIWVTEARQTPDGLVVDDCYRAADEWGANRETAHAGLRSRVTDFATAGLDFPFSLPQAVLDECCDGTWRGLLEWVGDGPGDSDAFRSACRAGAADHAGTPSDLRRETDYRRAGLCPYGTQIRKQTFYGVRDVLGELAERDDATVRPMQDGDTGRDATGDDATQVVEVYPAATFGWLGLYREGYRDDRDRRSTNLDGIESCSVDPGGFRETYAEHHDALDSLAAAVSAGRVARNGDPPLYGPREEGHIYV